MRKEWNNSEERPVDPDERRQDRRSEGHGPRGRDRSRRGFRRHEGGRGGPGETRHIRREGDQADHDPAEGQAMNASLHATEWFDPDWLEAMGVEMGDDGITAQRAATARVLIVVGSPEEWSLPGEEVDETLRMIGMLAWTRRRPEREGSLLEQLATATVRTVQWMLENPLATFWSASARAPWVRRRRGD